MRRIISEQTIPDIPARIEVKQNQSAGYRFRAGTFLLATLAVLFSQATVPSIDNRRQLDLYHTHTGDSLNIIYHDGQRYIPEALGQINHFLGDFRTGTEHPIDPATLDILFRLQAHFGGSGTFEIISAYRSPETNARLRALGREVAKRSLHMEGKAIDVRFRKVDTARLRDAAIALKLGGVGYYQASDFVHVDNGRVRTW